MVPSHDLCAWSLRRKRSANMNLADHWTSTDQHDMTVFALQTLYFRKLLSTHIVQTQRVLVDICHFILSGIPIIPGNTEQPFLITWHAMG